jgi:hypothetical protein
MQHSLRWIASEQFEAYDGNAIRTHCWRVSALASSIEKCTVLTSVSERYACYEALREVFSRPRGDVRSKGVFKQSSGSMRRRGGKGRGARPATCQEGADAGIAVLVGLSGSTLGRTEIRVCNRQSAERCNTQ